MKQLEKKMEKVEARVAKNESISRKHNLRFYGLKFPVIEGKGKEEKEDLVKVIKEILREGCKMEEGFIQHLLIDAIHRTDKNRCVIVALVQRTHAQEIMKSKKHLAKYKCPYSAMHNKSLSIVGDLTEEEREEKKKATQVLNKLKAQGKNAKMVGIDRIVINSGKSVHYKELQ